MYDMKINEQTRFWRSAPPTIFVVNRMHSTYPRSTLVFHSTVCKAHSGQQHLPALRVLVALGGGAQHRQAALRGVQPEEAAGVRAHAEDVAVAHDAVAGPWRVGTERGVAARVRGLAAAPLEAQGLPQGAWQ